MSIATLPRRAPAFPQWRVPALFASAETFLEREREQLALWWVVALGGGIATWLALASPRAWTAGLLLLVGTAGLGATLGRGRVGRSIAGFALAAALELGLIWLRSEWVASPRLGRPVITECSGRVTGTQQLAARDSVRLTIAPEIRHCRHFCA
ncbi:MAG: hypothetical protein AVDCRST_MAG62-291 [uncultured Sphingomonas sp.]|uniref:DUF4131 domain-containing protein n=1 Tax=uncultured Sphingomonas sp. TaxID=158754 RepID=A0A6J4SWC9_9SPHN|nr:MAG: hypothetical protein AVDCRST_MAG62-291 [uncultured Sphingomonas sp.]